MHASQHIRSNKELHHHPGLHVPGDVTVKRPQAGIIGHEAYYAPRVGFESQRVASQRVRNRVRRWHDVVVVVRPVKWTGTCLQDPLGQISAQVRRREAQSTYE
jgi:hypothetical protein